jgi:hypothetical protein
MTAAWTAETTPEAAARRAGGRRHYNAWRQHLAFYRRVKLSRLLFAKGKLFERGNQARLARELGVSRATICRDVRAILAWGHPCPCCGAYTKPPAVASITVFEDEEWPDEPALSSPPPGKVTMDYVLGFFHGLSRHTTCATFRRLTRYTVKAFQEQLR